MPPCDTSILLYRKFSFWKWLWVLFLSGVFFIFAFFYVPYLTDFFSKRYWYLERKKDNSIATFICILRRVRMIIFLQFLAKCTVYFVQWKLTHQINWFHVHLKQAVYFIELFIKFKMVASLWWRDRMLEVYFVLFSAKQNWATKSGYPIPKTLSYLKFRREAQIVN